MKATKVVIADDHALMLAALKRVLRDEEGIEVVGEARSGAEVVPVVDDARPDVVLLDVQMPDVDGLTCLAMIRRRFPDVAVIVLSASSDPHIVAGARAAGAQGYVLKTVAPDELVRVLRAISPCGAFVTLGIPEGRRPSRAVQRLTGREGVVVEGLFRGMSNRELARELHVSEQTVKFHLQNIYRKLDVTSREEAVREAYGAPAAAS
jgi:DNA-binding NarL/FixJ family response regulator